MPHHPTIAQRLDDRAAAEPAAAAELGKASKKITAFTRAPGKRRDADRMAAVLTPAVVEALGEAFVALRTEEIADPPQELMGCEFRQADHAFAALLIAAGDADLAEHARPALDHVDRLLPEMIAAQAEHVHYLCGLYPEFDVAQQLRATAWARLAQEPGSAGELWARSLGLELPDGYWSLYLTVPPREGERRIGDVGVTIMIEHTSGRETDWTVRIGAINANGLGGNRGPVWPDTAHGTYDRGPELAGVLEPAADLNDIPRVLRDLEAAHDALDYDREAMRASGSPGRLLSPTRKKLLITWLTPPS